MAWDGEDANVPSSAPLMASPSTRRRCWLGYWLMSFSWIRLNYLILTFVWQRPGDRTVIFMAMLLGGFSPPDPAPPDWGTKDMYQLRKERSGVAVPVSPNYSRGPPSRRPNAHPPPHIP